MKNTLNETKTELLMAVETLPIEVMVDTVIREHFTSLTETVQRKLDIYKEDISRKDVMALRYMARICVGEKVVNEKIITCTAEFRLPLNWFQHLKVDLLELLSPYLPLKLYSWVSDGIKWKTEVKNQPVAVKTTILRACPHLPIYDNQSNIRYHVGFLYPSEIRKMHAHIEHEGECRRMTLEEFETLKKEEQRQYFERDRSWSYSSAGWNYVAGKPDAD